MNTEQILLTYLALGTAWAAVGGLKLVKVYDGTVQSEGAKRLRETHERHERDAQAWGIPPALYRAAAATAITLTLLVRALTWPVSVAATLRRFLKGKSE